MANDPIRTGKITKVVHVRFAAGRGGHETALDRCVGYGILQGADGQDVFFVDTAVQDALLTDLDAGDAALYVMESSPLHRAAQVWVASSRTQIEQQLGESRGDRAVHSQVKAPQRA
jgi:cold shock CspA family protein